FLIRMNNEVRFLTIVRLHIPYEICRFLIESIGIVLAIPITILIASLFMKLRLQAGGKK
ncbi:MAG TPA: YibE/F family protein, partial [Lachnospiraceae bacterium]|nr:YibE/F family protein [Lachnospiraceae bacterium]